MVKCEEKFEVRSLKEENEAIGLRLGLSPERSSKFEKEPEIAVFTNW